MNERLEARAAIADLVHTYALNVRNGHGCADLFTEDATFEIREALVAAGRPARTRARLVGPNAITSYVEGAATRVCPLIYNLLIDVNGSEAASNCLMTTLVWSSNQQIFGEYQDAFRFDTRWRFTARIFTVLGEFSMHPTPRSGPST